MLLGAVTGFAIFGVLMAWDAFKAWYYTRPFEELLDPTLKETFLDGS
jgi:hypothetical protein